MKDALAKSLPFLKTSAVLLGGRLLGAALTFGYTIILARIADPAAFGLVMSGFAAAVLLSSLISLNFEAGSIRFLVQYRKEKDVAREIGFLRMSWITVIAATGVLFALGAIGWAIGAFDLSETNGQVGALALAAAPWLAVTRLYARHGTAIGHVLRGGLPVNLFQPGLVFLLLALVWASGYAIGSVGLMQQFLGAIVVTAGLQFLLLNKALRAPVKAFESVRANFDAWRIWFKTAGYMAPLHVMRNNLKHVAVLSAGLTVSSEGVAPLAIALSFMALFLFAVKAVDLAMSPRISRALQAQDHTEATSLLASAALAKAAICVLGFVVLVLVGDVVIRIFGEAYSSAFVPLLILTAIPASEAIWGPAQLVLNVSGRQNIVARLAMVSGFFVVVAIAVGGLWGDATGASAGLAFGYCLQQALLHRMSRREVGIETSILSAWSPRPAN